jgi:hypothetical protein
MKSLKLQKAQQAREGFADRVVGWLKKMMGILPRRIAGVFRSELNRLAELSDIFNSSCVDCVEKRTRDYGTHA